MVLVAESIYTTGFAPITFGTRSGTPVMPLVTRLAPWCNGLTTVSPTNPTAFPVLAVLSARPQPTVDKNRDQLMQLLMA